MVGDRCWLPIFYQLPIKTLLFLCVFLSYFPKNLFGLCLTSKGYFNFSGYLLRKCTVKQGKMAIFRVIFPFSGFFNLWRLSPKNNLKRFSGYSVPPLAEIASIVGLTGPERSPQGAGRSEKEKIGGNRAFEQPRHSRC